jgi:hypothetical protein
VPATCPVRRERAEKAPAKRSKSAAELGFRRLGRSSGGVWLLPRRPACDVAWFRELRGLCPTNAAQHGDWRLTHHFVTALCRRLPSRDRGRAVRPGRYLGGSATDEQSTKPRSPCSTLRAIPTTRMTLAAAATARTGGDVGDDPAGDGRSPRGHAHLEGKLPGHRTHPGVNRLDQPLEGVGHSLDAVALVAIPRGLGRAPVRPRSVA